MNDLASPSNIEGVTGGVGNAAVIFGYLKPGEKRVLGEAIRVAYGDSRDVRQRR
jgi:hypothetical protein